MKLYEPQPAILMYPLSGGWKVIKYVGQKVFPRTQSAATFWYRNAKVWRVKAEDTENTLWKYWCWMAYAGLQIAGFCQYAAALLIVMTFFIFQILLLVVWALLAGVLVAILSAGNYLYSNIHKIFYRCPECHRQMTIPVYICPKCATRHTRLWPSVYGVFYHRCEKCNTKLPTLDVLGRKDLVRRCPYCDAPLNKEIGRLVNVHIPIVGGPSVGKSNYIVMAIHQFIKEFANPRKYLVEFPDKKHGLQYQHGLELLLSGQTLVKTSAMLPSAQNITVKKNPKHLGRIIYLYDAAGEVYENEDEARRQGEYLEYVSGVLFMIDPFSIDYYYRTHEAEIEKIKSAIRPGPRGTAVGSYERMLERLVSRTSYSGGKIKLPLAVVVSKTDGLGLEDEIGLGAAQALMNGDPAIRLVEDAIDILVRKFLKANRLDNLVRGIENSFENVKFFSCSSLGRLPDDDVGQPYHPVRVLEPFLWLLSQANVLKANEVRLHKIDEVDKHRAREMGNIFKAAKYYYWESLRPHHNEMMSRYFSD